VGDTGLEPM